MVIHRCSYIGFEGTIGEGKYGAGEVVIWDAGEYELIGKPATQLNNGNLDFILYGEKLRGKFKLIRMEKRERQWLLIKGHDEFADPAWKLSLVLEHPLVD